MIETNLEIRTFANLYLNLTNYMCFENDFRSRLELSESIYGINSPLKPSDLQQICLQSHSDCRHFTRQHYTQVPVEMIAGFHIIAQCML